MGMGTRLYWESQQGSPGGSVSPKEDSDGEGFVKPPLLTPVMEDYKWNQRWVMNQ